LRAAPAGGRGGGTGRSTDGQRSAGAVTTATNASSNAEPATQQGSGDQSVVSEITESGSQHGRNFVRGAY
jgi:hypothetical protein